MREPGADVLHFQVTLEALPTGAWRAVAKPEQIKPCNFTELFSTDATMWSPWYVSSAALAALPLSQVCDQELLLGHLKGLAQQAAERQAALQARIDR